MIALRRIRLLHLSVLENDVDGHIFSLSDGTLASPFLTREGLIVQEELK